MGNIFPSTNVHPIITNNPSQNRISDFLLRWNLKLDFACTKRTYLLNYIRTVLAEITNGSRYSAIAQLQILNSFSFTKAR